MSWHALSNEINLFTSEIATLLALISAIAHAAFGALQKGKHNPWLVRGSMDFWYFLISLPIALFLVPSNRVTDSFVHAACIDYYVGLAQLLSRQLPHTVLYVK